jgi:hypothetical protein
LHNRATIVLRRLRIVWMRRAALAHFLGEGLIIDGVTEKPIALS